MKKKRGNRDNAQYYENISPVHHKDFIKLAGLDDHSDLKLITPQIQAAESLLEVGAGDGRVLNYLQNMGYTGQVTAVERSGQFFAALQESHGARYNLYHCDINDFAPEASFDLILWMWAGISDFTTEEQHTTIAHLASLLTPRGQIILDTFAHDAQPLNADEATMEQSFTVERENACLHGYLPSPEEIAGYAKEIGLTHCHHQAYKTSKDRPRVLHFLKK